MDHKLVLELLRVGAKVSAPGSEGPTVNVPKKLLSDAADVIEEMESDLRSILMDFNVFECIMLREKWGFTDES